MLVRFMVDYRGVLTGEVFYRAGEVVALDEPVALALVRAGRAVSAEPPEPDKPARKGRG